MLAQHGDEGKPLAGGQSLLPLLAMRLAQPAHVLDLERVEELRGIEVAAEAVTIRAMTRQAELERRGAELALPAAVRYALPHIGHFQIRNRGTVGGSIAHCDPAAEWPALLLLLDGVVTARSLRGERRIGAEAFCRGPLTTALEPDELLVDVRITARGGPSAFAEVERRFGDFALVGAACDGGRVVVFGAGGRPQRLAQVEAYLAGGGTDLAEVTALAAEEVDAISDLHATAFYRKETAGRLVAQVVGSCLS